MNSTPPDHREEERRLDRLAMRYLTAFDADDFDTLSALWHLAETDAGLCQALLDLNAALAGEVAL